ncbi:MAG: ABC-ATPase UvrA [Patescibacteria group bacterium]|nr:MAG: ABC-ATPase UvrA [Patescibacteria group bacterium]
MSVDKITIKGAREHNLKNINIEIPKNKLVVFTGISGSGKSSLAFDTIYAEGQRRYVESLSAYARQFLGVMRKPDVDQIDGLSPAISIDQKTTSHNPRSTVGTTTEIYDYMRLLFARIGHPHCPICGREIQRMAPEQITDAILHQATQIITRDKQAAARGVRMLILAPMVRERKGEFSNIFTQLRKQGYTRARIDGSIRDLSEDFALLKTNKHSIEAVVDRLVISKQILDEIASGQPSETTQSFRLRLNQSVEQALKLSEGNLIASEVQDDDMQFPANPTKMSDHLYSEKFACPVDNIAISEIEPRTFSFNSPQGACPTCTGLGTELKIDPELVLNPHLSVSEGGILPWNRLATTETWFSRLLAQVAKEKNISLTTPIGELSAEALETLLYGTKKESYRVEGENRQGNLTSIVETFEGVIPNLMRRYRETDSEYIRSEIEKYMRQEPCPDCKGKRLKAEALSVTIDERSIWDVNNQSIRKALSWVTEILQKNILSPRELVIAKPIIKEITNRLEFLIDVGLDYLTLTRTAGTLAGGESQRIRLASQIGSGLTGVLYVLDEPSIGLHQRDNTKLINTLKKLRELGNTVIVVEHDDETMEEADYIFDFGPAAGEHGGQIIAHGTPAQLMADKKSITGAYLSGRKQVEVDTTMIEKYDTQNSELVNTSKGRRKVNKEIQELKIVGASEHNLKHVDISIPLGKFICVTGVSGSGKSTLVHDILYRSLAAHFYQSKEKPGAHDGILGIEALDKVVMIDQSPIGRTPRSNPATYTGAFTYIRELFAKTNEAQIRGYGPGRFSFNVKGGRCEVCQGDGVIKIEMQFLPDVYVNCDACNGRRYNREALEILYRGKSIADVLEMTVEEALSFFQNIPALKNKLETIFDVGLGYIKLGQPATQLSGGEAQRIKLATELSKRPTGHTLYILDEPTTGLHFQDISRLLTILRRLVLYNNTVLVIEHNLDVIRNADWLIDLGPEGGDGGGTLVAAGTPSQIAEIPASYTGKYLKKLFTKQAKYR